MQESGATSPAPSTPASISQGIAHFCSRQIYFSKSSDLKHHAVNMSYVSFFLGLFFFPSPFFFIFVWKFSGNRVLCHRQRGELSINLALTLALLR